MENQTIFRTNANAPDWTKERVKTLKRLHAKGLSRRQIAASMGGVSRSAVIGKLQRLGLADGPAIIWTEERTAKLYELYRNPNISYPTMAAQLGVSRTTVQNKVKRLKLAQAHGRRKAGGKPGVFALPTKSKTQHMTFGERAQHKRKMLAKAKPIAEPECPANFLGLTLLDLKPITKLERNQCRYPRGGDGAPILFCGQPTAEGASYCGDCSRIVYQVAA